MSNVVFSGNDGRQCIASRCMRASAVDSALVSETSEAWEVDILDGAMVRRTLTRATTSVTCPAADQAADFGTSPLASVTFCVFRIGTLGHGDGCDGEHHMTGAGNIAPSLMRTLLVG